MCSSMHQRLERAGEGRGEGREKTVTQKESVPVSTERGDDSVQSSIICFIKNYKTLNVT